MPHPSERAHMIFVDGENFTIRGQEFAKANGVKLEAGSHWQKDVFLWMPGVDGDLPLYTDTEVRFHSPPIGFMRGGGGGIYQEPARDIRSIRAHYFTAVTGDDDALVATKLSLRDIGFQPEVFKKVKGARSKGVDVGLTTAMLSHAYQGNYEVAYLIAGDGDYEPLVNEVRRLGRIVVVVFFAEYGLNPALRIAGDQFIDISDKFASWWERMYARREREQKEAEQKAQAEAKKESQESPNGG
jgi:uncharacterized LabA/DUF88 family protein